MKNNYIKNSGNFEKNDPMSLSLLGRSEAGHWSGRLDPPNWFISYWIHPQPGHGPTDSKKCPEKFIYWIHYTLYSGQPTLKITKIGSGELIFES